MSLKYTLVILALALACFVASPAHAAITAAERKATLKFLNEFVDEYKKVLRNVWTGDDYCQWSGVTCDANGDVHVDLSGRGLDGDMPEPKKKEGSLIRVVSINLSNNPSVSDDFEEDWEYLTNLRKIDLSYTSLKGYVPDSWRSMSSLEEIYVHHTAACRNLPDWSGRTMPNLRIADFSYNNFHGSIRGDWNSFSKLERLDLSGNNFCGCAPSSWAGNAVLTKAAASTAMASNTCAYNSCGNYKNCPKAPNSGTSAAPTPAPQTTTKKPTATTKKPTATTKKPAATTTTSAPAVNADQATRNVLALFAQGFPKQLSSWTGVNHCSWTGVSCAANGEVSVDLGNRGLSGVVLDRVGDSDGKNARIVSINLSHNTGVTGFFPDSWANLKQLRSLDLSYTSLSGAIPSSWNGMISIQTITITNTKACYGLPNWSMTSVRSIDLSNNAGLKGALASSWAKMTALQSAKLSGDSFCACVPSEWAAKPVLQAAVSTTANAAALRNVRCGLTNMCSYANFRCV